MLCLNEKVPDTKSDQQNSLTESNQRNLNALNTQSVKRKLFAHYALTVVPIQPAPGQNSNCKGNTAATNQLISRRASVIRLQNRVCRNWNHVHYSFRAGSAKTDGGDVSSGSLIPPQEERRLQSYLGGALDHYTIDAPCAGLLDGESEPRPQGRWSKLLWFIILVIYDSGLI